MLILICVESSRPSITIWSTKLPPIIFALSLCMDNVDYLRHSMIVYSSVNIMIVPCPRRGGNTKWNSTPSI